MNRPAATPASQRLIVLHPSGVTRAAEGQRERVTRFEPQPAPDLQSVRADGFREGHASGRLEAMAEFEQQRQTLEASHRSEMKRQGEEIAQVMAQRFGAEIERARTLLAAASAAALRPLVEKLIRTEALDAIFVELGDIMRESLPTAIVVKGDKDMLAGFAARLNDGGLQVVYEAGEGPDIRISVDQMLLETRIGEWIKNIEAAL